LVTGREKLQRLRQGCASRSRQHKKQDCGFCPCSTQLILGKGEYKPDLEGSDLRQSAHDKEEERGGSIWLQ
jgi:hypothetical protein